MSSDTQLENLLLIDSDNLIGINELTDNTTGQFIAGATVVAQVIDSDGAQIGNDVTLTHVPAKDGQYLGTFPAAEAALLVANDLYTVEITVSAPNVLKICRGMMAVCYDGVLNG